MVSATNSSELEPVSNKNGVTGVTGVTCPDTKGLPCNPTPDDGVTRGYNVPEPLITEGGKSLPEISVPETERAQYKVNEYRATCKESGRTLKPGTWLYSMTSPKGDALPMPVETWICGPLHVEAQTADEGGNSYGRLLRFKTTRNQWREWAMPMHLLKASGEELRGELLDMGLAIAPDQKQLLSKYLQAMTPNKQMLCSASVGWCNGVYVLPTEVIGQSADSAVIFQHPARIGDECSTAGTLEDWQSSISTLAMGNPLMMLAMSVAFAGPLLHPCHAESGGLHIVGDSSAGKSTIQKVAVSIYGSPEYRRSWRATANGLEGTAALHNDGLLALDEISECEPKQVGATIYMLGNGQGKQRASRTGAARSVARWRTVLLSTGERTIGATMLEGGQRQKTGQSLRLLDLPTDRKHGAFDDLHHFDGGQALADHLITACNQQYGHASRVFIQALVDDDADHAKAYAALREAPCFNVPGIDQQEARAAARFALYAYAGELATQYGITQWHEGAALDAAVDGFNAWRKMRGTGRDEPRQIMESLADFIDKHGDSRFSDCASMSDVRDRAGWFEDSHVGGKVYLFTSGGLHEALTGFDFKRALNVLEAAGVLPPASPDGRRSKAQRIGGEPRKVYSIQAQPLREALQ